MREIQVHDKIDGELLEQAWSQRANGALCGLPLTEYLALSRCERKARLRAAKKGAHRG